MARRVILASFPVDALDDLRAQLEATGHTVTGIEDVDGILDAVRSRSADLIVLGEMLHGGTGSDVLSVLDAMSTRPMVLYLGEDSIPGSDASVRIDDVSAIVEKSLALLGTKKDDTLGWSVKANPLAEAVSDAGGKPGNGKTPRAAPSPPPLNAPDRIETLIQRIREADYYEILGVAPTATDAEIRTSYHALIGWVRDQAKAGRRDGQGAGKAEGQAWLRGAHLDEVESVLAEALAVLGDPALRAAYTRNLL